MRVIVRPSGAPNLHIDVTRALTSAIAHELARVHEGNDVLNWLEAERLLDELVSRRPVTEAGPVSPAGNVPREVVPSLARSRRSSRGAMSSLSTGRDIFDAPRAASPMR